MREFDAAYTAPHFGFASAEDYYHRASAMRVASRIRVPALVITAEDDPFVPAAPVPQPGAGAESVRPRARHAARRALRFPGADSGGVGRLLGGAADRRVRERGLRRPAAKLPHAPTRPRRHLRLQLPGVARHVLSREVQHRQDAGVLCRALLDRRDQLHLLSHAEREAARRLERGNARALFVHAQGAAADHARRQAAALRRSDADVLPDRADARPQARHAALPAAADVQEGRGGAARLPRAAARAASAPRSSSGMRPGTIRRCSTSCAPATSRSASPTARR